MTLLAWFAYEWAAFQTRSNAAISRLRVTRHVLQGGREVPMLWSGIAFEVRVTIENPSPIGIPFLVLEDRPAVATEAVSGSDRLFASIPAGGQVEIVYSLKSPSPGILRFEGRAASDSRTCTASSIAACSFVIRSSSSSCLRWPTMKAASARPSDSTRCRRRAFTACAGPGREANCSICAITAPGDPPKMIAWKPSARRDRLITKEFENDVPVRCVLFLDTREGVRLGPPGNTLLTRMAGVAAAVAQASAANRDLVGLTTFDEDEAKGMAPGADQDPHDQRAAPARGGLRAATGRDRRPTRTTHSPRVPAGPGTLPGADGQAREHDAARGGCGFRSSTASMAGFPVSWSFLAWGFSSWDPLLLSPGSIAPAVLRRRYRTAAKE